MTATPREHSDRRGIARLGHLVPSIPQAPIAVYVKTFSWDLAQSLQTLCSLIRDCSWITRYTETESRLCVGMRSFYQCPFVVSDNGREVVIGNMPPQRDCRCVPQSLT
jgi:hypothetical protein